MSRQQIVLAAMFAAIVAAVPPVLTPSALAQATATAQRETSVEADQMEFLDAEKKAVFTGNVDARRGDVKLTSETLTVFYRQKPGAKAEAGTAGAASTSAGAATTAADGTATPPAAPEGATGNLSGAEVTLLDAKGNVVIITPRERITGDWAKIDVPKDMLTVGGNVVLTQGTSVLRGQKLDVNLKTNRTVMTGGRVKGQFVPQ
jgi:lipopolysaccharide export system protein LptA